MTTVATTELAPDETHRLIEFARAFKAAARAVVLYPAAHPAISTTLGRIVDVTSAGQLTAPLRIGVLADSLLLGGLAPGRPDAAIGELAVLLHDHLIGELTVRAGGDIDAWRSFLLLIGRAPDDVRSEGGIAKLWNHTAGRHVELREIDYAEVLKERDATGTSSWSDIVAHCLSGDRSALDEPNRQLLVAVAGRLETIERLIATVDAAAVSAGSDEATRAATLIKLLDRVACTVSETHPDRVTPLFKKLGSALERLPPDILMAVLTQPIAGTETPGLVRSVFGQMSDRHTARFVARHALSEGTAPERLAQVFQTLVPEDRRSSLLALAKVEASSAAGDLDEFEERWETVAQALLTSYSDKPFVSEQYARELSRSHETALDVERVSDDPPERMNAWLASVSASELRRLDVALVGDLLRVESDADQWRTLMRPAVALVDDLMLVGDFEAADGLVKILVRERQSGGTIHRQAAAAAIDALIGGPMIHRVAGHLGTAEEGPFESVKGTFLALGNSMVAALAEVLIEESDERTRERMMAMFIAFGAAGRLEVERLKTSPSAAVRRTVIALLRQFGGPEALSDLSGFLHDDDSQVQREAVRAILGLGAEQGYAMLGQALTDSTPVQRDVMMAALNASRGGRCVPVYSYILRHVDHRGASLTDLHLRAIKALGALRDPDGIDSLKEVLHRGEWWAPRRTSTLREASATALARIGTAAALGVLEDAVVSGSRGVRIAARAHLTTIADGGRARDTQ